MRRDYEWPCPRKAIQAATASSFAAQGRYAVPPFRLIERSRSQQIAGRQLVDGADHDLVGVAGPIAVEARVERLGRAGDKRGRWPPIRTGRMNIKRLLAAALFDRPDKIGEALEINIPDRTDGIIEGISRGPAAQADREEGHRGEGEEAMKLLANAVLDTTGGSFWFIGGFPIYDPRRSPPRCHPKAMRARGSAPCSFEVARWA